MTFPASPAPKAKVAATPVHHRGSVNHRGRFGGVLRRANLPPTVLPLIVLPLIVLALVASACGGDAEPAQGDPGDLTDVTHVLEPTDQMRQAAEQQCIDNPDQTVGYVRAVAPDTGNVMAEFEVDCAEVRAAG